MIVVLVHSCQSEFIICVEDRPAIADELAVLQSARNVVSDSMQGCDTWRANLCHIAYKAVSDSKAKNLDKNWDKNLG